MAQLTIKGNVTRGGEVIETLEMLGGKNKGELKGTDTNLVYYIHSEGYIATLYSTSSKYYKNFTIEEFFEEFPYKVGDKVQHKGATSCGSVFEVEKMRWEEDTIKYTLRLFGCNYKTSTLTAEYLQPYKEETMEEKKINQMSLANCELDEVEIILGDKFELKIKEGKYYAVKKQLKYPKTYKECCEVLALNTMDNDAQGYKAYLIISFQELIIARNAYWKIAGEQMGLDKPWEPDWDNEDKRKQVITCQSNNIIKDICFIKNTILAFPTEKMRDAFYENFKDLIEECKEFL